ncbi:MAG TPA: hypothetical protein PLP23_06295 [Panacibacter sp.]|nr:hypothetical protein [Panacibacter sp.]
MKINSIICCESIITDLETKGTSLFNIIERISIQSFPFFLPKFSIFISSENDDLGKIEGQLKVSNNNRQLYLGKVIFNFYERNITRNIIRFNGLVIPEAGTLMIEIIHENVVLKTHIIGLESFNNNQPVVDVQIPTEPTANI